MLALLFRGVFFMGVVGWYSAGVWKMIDDYFKERFERYLQEEYERNPKMHEDVLVYGAVDKMGRGGADQPGEVGASSLLDSCDLDSCPVGEAGSAAPCGLENESVPQANAAGAGAGKEVAGTVNAAGSGVQEESEPPDKTEDTVFLDGNNSSLVKDEDLTEEQEKIYLEFEILQAHEDSQSEAHNETLPQLINEEDEGTQNIEEASNIVIPEPEEKEALQTSKKAQNFRRKRKTRAEPKIVVKPEEGVKRTRGHKKKIRTLTLTEKDFEVVRRRRGFSGEFDEFDEERNGAPGEKFPGDEEYDGTGIAVADLPFKPAIDVYDLERVSGEEFCPLTLDDDPSCEESRGWP